MGSIVKRLSDLKDGGGGAVRWAAAEGAIGGIAMEEGQGVEVAGDGVDGGPRKGAEGGFRFLRAVFRGRRGVCLAKADGKSSLHRGAFGLDERGEAAVDAADAADAADHFLTDVASFVVIDGGGVQTGFGRKEVGGEFVSPRGDGVQDFEGRLVFWRKRRKLRQPERKSFRGDPKVVAGRAEAGQDGGEVTFA